MVGLGGVICGTVLAGRSFQTTHVERATRAFRLVHATPNHTSTRMRTTSSAREGEAAQANRVDRTERIRLNYLSKNGGYTTMHEINASVDSDPRHFDALVLVPTIIILKHRTLQREWQHKERMKAMEIGCPRHPSTARRKRRRPIGAGVPIASVLAAVDDNPVLRAARR